MTGFQNYTGLVEADMLRLNLAIPPAKQPEQHRACWAATRPGSRTAAGSATTS